MKTTVRFILPYPRGENAHAITRSAIRIGMIGSVRTNLASRTMGCIGLMTAIVFAWYSTSAPFTTSRPSA